MSCTCAWGKIAKPSGIQCQCDFCIRERRYKSRKSKTTPIKTKKLSPKKQQEYLWWERHHTKQPYTINTVLDAFCAGWDRAKIDSRRKRKVDHDYKDNKE